MNIGKLVQERRKELQMTQNELAEGICTQAMVSKIEKGIINPSSSLLKDISDRLEIPISYFYEDDDEEKKVKKVEEDVRDCINKSEHLKALEKLTENKEIFLNAEKDYYKQFYKMVYHSNHYYVDKDASAAISGLNSLLDEVSPSSLLYLEILASLGVIYYLDEQHTKADETYQKVIEKLNRHTDYQFRIRFLHNYALNLGFIGKDEEALEIIIQATDELIKKQSLYNLGNLFYLKGFLLRKEELYKESLEEFENAMFVFKITNFQKMFDQTQDKVNELKEILEKS